MICCWKEVGMNRKSFLDELKVLLCVNLEPSEVKSAYQYYSELFDEEDEDALISRLGSPQSAVDGILEGRGSAGHTIRGGMSALFLSLRVRGYRFKAVLWILIMLFVLLCELLVASVIILDLYAVLTFRYIWKLWVLRDLSALSFCVLLIVITVRHMPYAVFRRRKKNE